MKVLLAGYGDLARRLTPFLLEDRWQVAGLRRNPAGEGEPIPIRPGDCSDPGVLHRALADTDIAVFTLTPDAFTEQAYRSTYPATAKALAGLIQSGKVQTRYIVWVSSTSVYGQGQGEWVDEETVPRPTGFPGRILLEAEEVIRQLPVPVTVVRFSGIYGPGRDRLLEIVRGGRIAPPLPRVWTNRIHSDDCAGVLNHLLLRFRIGLTNPTLLLATDCCPVTAHEVQAWLAGQMSIAAVPGAAADIVRGNRRCSNSRLLATGYEFRYPDYASGYRRLLDEL